MGKPAVALIVAGSGETNEREVFDLLEDAYPEDDYSEVGLIVGVSKSLFTPAVQHVIEWLGDPESVYAILPEGENMTRASSKYGTPQEVKSFADIFEPDEFEDWDEVHFLVAVPDDPNAPEYEEAADLVEKALDAGVKVFNLSRGLDDVTLEEPSEEPAEEPAEEEFKPGPDPEPEKPQRRSRARKAEPVDEEANEPKNEPEEPAQASRDGLQEELAAAAHAVRQERENQPSDSRFRYHPPTDQTRVMHETARSHFAALTEFTESVGEPSRERSLAVTKIEEAMFWLNAHIARNITGENEQEEPAQAEDKPTAKDGTKRGRPRTNFEVSQIWDENAEEWVPRPKGRAAKGTKWRKIHAETGEVLEEGTA